MTNLPDPRTSVLLEQVGAIVAAYVSRNTVVPGELPHLIDQVHSAIAVLRDASVLCAATRTKPTAAEIAASIGPDGLVSFIDGRSYQTLKRHLTANNLTPEEYRTRYGLPADYPMVAPGYATRRSEIAKAIQLGYKAA